MFAYLPHVQSQQNIMSFLLYIERLYFRILSIIFSDSAEASSNILDVYLATLGIIITGNNSNN
jgi:hypothetical protein